jgi:hypothetical protein
MDVSIIKAYKLNKRLAVNSDHKYLIQKGEDVSDGIGWNHGRVGKVND